MWENAIPATQPHTHPLNGPFYGKAGSDVCCRLQEAPSGESYEGKCRPGRKQWQTTAGYMAWFTSCHLRADCLYTGISSGPTLGNEYGKTLPYLLPFCGQRWLNFWRDRNTQGEGKYVKCDELTTVVDELSNYSLHLRRSSGRGVATIFNVQSSRQSCREN